MVIQIQSQSSSSHLKQEFIHNRNGLKKTFSKRKELINDSNSPDLKAKVINKSESTNALVYKFLLNQIQLTARYIHIFKIIMLQIFYFFQFNFQSVKIAAANSIKKLNSNEELLSNLNKLVPPSHVCVILNEKIDDNQKLYETFDLIATFLSSMGVKTLTFYQFDGFSNELKEKLIEKFELKKDLNNNDLIPENNQVIKRHSEKILNENRNEESEAQQLQNVSLSSKKIDLKFFSYVQGGRSVLIRACKNIANKINNNCLDLNDLDKDLIDTHIIESTDMNEPQLVINIGSIDSLAGFSPWHLRLSEIIKIPSYKLINKNSLINILIKYSKIEKRVGK